MVQNSRKPGIHRESFIWNPGNKNPGDSNIDTEINYGVRFVEQKFAGILNAGDMAALLRSMEIQPSEPLLARHTGERFVVKCGGTLVENPATGDPLLGDVAVLARSGIRVVLVHGGSVQADRDMEAAGIVPQRHRGLRITCERTIEILDRCFGRLNADIGASLLKLQVLPPGHSPS